MKKNEETRILIADPSAEDRERMRVLLNIGGYYDLAFVEDMPDAFKALGVADTQNERGMDLILMDLFARNNDGLKWLSVIKSMEQIRDIPFIIVTGNTNLEDMLSAFEIGAQDYIVKPVDDKIEMIARVNTAVRLKKETDVRKAREKELMEITRLLDESNKQLQEANEHLEAVASVDGLTGVANRRYFDDYASKEWRRAQRIAIPVSVIMMDLDYFKLYNDTYGHQQGDECLKQFASVLKDVFKRPSDLPARYGGEEFIAILPDTDIKGAMTLARNMQARVTELEIAHEKSQTGSLVTCSMGVASSVPGHGSTHLELIACADRALYEAKARGRNRIIVYNDTMSQG